MFGSKKEEKDPFSLKSVYKLLTQAWMQLMGDDILAKSILKNQLKKLDINELSYSMKDMEALLRSLEKVAKDLKSSSDIKRAFKPVHQMLHQEALLRTEEIIIESEYDIVKARNIGASVAKTIGFGSTDSVKIATIISELARNIILYAKQGSIQITPISDIQKGIHIVAKDHGKGIKNLDAVMDGKYVSEKGMGMGLRGVKNLADKFEITSSDETGTTIIVRKYLR